MKRLILTAFSFLSIFPARAILIDTHLTVALPESVKSLESPHNYGGAVIIATEYGQPFHWFQMKPITVIQITKRLNELYYGKTFSLEKPISL